jgi:hypothetical protein
MVMMAFRRSAILLLLRQRQQVVACYETVVLSGGESSVLFGIVQSKRMTSASPDCHLNPFR